MEPIRSRPVCSNMPDVAAKAKLRQSPNGCSSGWWHAAFQKVKTVTVSRHVPPTVDILDILDVSYLFWNSLVVCGETRSHSHCLHVLACGMQSNWCHMALAATSKTNFGSRSPVPSHKKAATRETVWPFETETHRFLKSGPRLGERARISLDGFRLTGLHCFAELGTGKAASGGYCLSSPTKWIATPERQGCSNLGAFWHFKDPGKYLETSGWAFRPSIRRCQKKGASATWLTTILGLKCWCSYWYSFWFLLNDVFFRCTRLPKWPWNLSMSRWLESQYKQQGEFPYVHPDG